MLIPHRFRLVAVFVVTAYAMTGCAAKPGTSVDLPGVAVKDPSSTQSITVLGYDKDTSISGPLNQETSLITPDKMQETNGGGAAKQRVGILITPDGSIRVLGSAASDIALAEAVTIYEDGKLKSVSFKGLNTSNSAVQRAVNEGVGLLVAQWQRSSDNERAVLEKQIEAQAALGDAVATTTLSVVKLLKGIP